MVTITKEKTISLETKIGDITLKNPVMTASGTFGYGQEFENFFDLNRLGAIITKGISLKPRKGNNPPRITETACGMLNAIGLENNGLDDFIANKLPYLEKLDTCVVANILGESESEYIALTEKLSEFESIKAIEVNISCPNVKKGGVFFGIDKNMAGSVIKSIRKNTNKHIIVKLSPNVTDIAEIAKSVENSGADSVSLINTVLGMAIDVKTRKPKLANIVGGLSGPAIKPIALRMVWQVAQAVKIPIIGIGGIMTYSDAIEFLIAGASAVQIGTANFVNPQSCDMIISGMEEYFLKNKIYSIEEIRSSLIV